MSTAVLIIGGSSTIARALARLLAAQGRGIILAGRDLPDLDASAADLRIRFGVPAVAAAFDALAFDTHAPFLAECAQLLPGGLDGIVLNHGLLPDQPDTQRDFALCRRTIDTNYTSFVSLLNLAANHFEARRSGFLCAVSSVAGDRGRQSNYLYGSTKAALSAYLQGLRNRLHPAGVRVLTVKPGFVDTAMTWGKLKNPTSPLVAQPDRVAADIDRAIRYRRDVIYTPWFWWPIMRIVKSIPEGVFKRLKM